MKKAIVIGNNAFAQMVRYYIENENSESAEIIAYSVERQFLTNTKAEDGLPVIAFEDVVAYAKDYEFYIAIGYSKMNMIRCNMYNSIINSGGDVKSYYHPSAIISPLAKLGKGNILFENTVIQPNVEIGNANIIQASCSILHHTIIGDFNFICGGSVINGVVKVGDCNFIGSNATLRNRIVLGSEVLVGANAFVDRSIDSGCVIVPPKSILLDKKSNEMKI